MYLLHYKGGFLSMAKKMKGNKKRSFKVHSDFNGGLYVRFGGKYLINELGLTCGDRLELTRDNDRLILRKYSAEEMCQYETEQKEKAVQALINKLLPDRSRKAQAPTMPVISTTPIMMVAENRTASAYTVEDELANNPKKYSQAENG